MKKSFLLILNAILLSSCGSEQLPEKNKAAAEKTQNAAEANDKKYSYSEKEQAPQSGYVSEDLKGFIGSAERTYCSQNLINSSTPVFLGCQAHAVTLPDSDLCKKSVEKFYKQYASEKCVVQIYGTYDDRVIAEMDFNQTTLNYTFIDQAHKSLSLKKPELSSAELDQASEVDAANKQKEEISSFYCNQNLVTDSNKVQQACRAEFEAINGSVDCNKQINKLFNTYKDARCAVALKYERSEKVFGSSVFSLELLKDTFVRNIVQGVICSRPE